VVVVVVVGGDDGDGEHNGRKGDSSWTEQMKMHVLLILKQSCRSIVDQDMSPKRYNKKWNEL
jgi:hypothetical protein